MPRSLWLTPAVAVKALPMLSEQPPWVQLAPFLLHQRARADSPWAAYLHCLPEALDSPVFWAVDEPALAELVGSQLGESAASYRAYVAGVWDGLAAGVLAASPAVFPAATFSPAAFLWAFGTLRARCLPPADLGSDLALIPGLDLVNHAGSAGPAWTPANAGGLLGGFGGAPPAASAAAMALLASRGVAAGEQLYGSYGSRLDSQLALDYGFVDALSPAPGYLLQLALAEGDRFADDKADVLEVARQAAAPAFALRPGQPPPPGLTPFLRLLSLGGPDAFLLEPIFRDQAWTLMQDPVSLANERAACTAVVQGAGAALAGFSCTAAADEAALRALASDDARMRLALRVRLGEKRGLLAALEAFQAAEAAAPGLEFYQERRLRSLKLMDEGGQSTYDPFNDSFKSW